jgi:hypothetical protein
MVLPPNAPIPHSAQALVGHAACGLGQRVIDRSAQHSGETLKVEVCFAEGVDLLQPFFACRFKRTTRATYFAEEIAPEEHR